MKKTLLVLGAVAVITLIAGSLSVRWLMKKVDLTLGL